MARFTRRSCVVSQPPHDFAIETAAHWLVLFRALGGDRYRLLMFRRQNQMRIRSCRSSDLWMQPIQTVSGAQIQRTAVAITPSKIRGQLGALDRAKMFPVR